MFSNLSKMVLTKRNLMILLLVVALVTISYLVYTYVVLPKVSPTFVQNNEFESDASEKQKEAEIMFFYVNWCPHCKTAKPEVEKLEKELAENNGALKGTNVKVQVNKINPEENDANRQKAEKNNVNAYPTVVIEDKNGGVKAELETGVTLDNLRDFIKNNL